MEQSSFQDEQTVRHQFDSLCKLALKSEVINYEKHMVIIPGLSEPPVRTLRATIPENERHIFR